MKNYISIAIILFVSWVGHSQSVDIDKLSKETPLKIKGGVSANTVFFNSNLRESRLPFTYYLNGNINFSFYGFNVPVSFSYSNQGSDLGYKTPFNINRLSIHPKYKWVTGHIGHVSMAFSPYTLSGHQFTGAGFDLAPNGPIKVSVMGGRLLKATENDDANTRTVPAFKRMGYGIKTTYEQEKFKIGIIGFYAKDDINSIAIVPDEKNITPKENLVLSLEGSVNLSRSLSIDVEYASSVVTQDLRSEKISEKPDAGPAGLLFSYKGSTESYYAVNARVNYHIERTTVGIGYERISPGYQTLGAYYFTNDFENITINASQPFFNDKLNLRFNLGYQRDDLEKQKSNTTNRIVGAVNANIIVSKKLNISGSYSNFQTFTNVKLNQFDVINDNNLLDNVTDELDYKQLSQTANLNFNYALSNDKTRRQNLSLNYSFNDVSNEQGGIVRIGNASTFHNMNGSYSLGIPENGINARAGINVTYNTIGRNDAVTWGPTINLSKHLLEKKLNTNIGVSYSVSDSRGTKSNILNLRANLRYVLLKKHNFMLSAIQLFRNNNTSTRLNELTVTFGYNYNFGIFTSKKKKAKEKIEKDKNDLKIKFKDYNFEGTKEEHITKLNKFSTNSAFDFIPQKYKTTLAGNIKDLEDNVEIENKEFKQGVIEYLEGLLNYNDLKKEFNTVFRTSYLELLKDAQDLDIKINEKYLDTKEKLRKAELDDREEDSKKYFKKFKLEEVRLRSHRLMLGKLKEISKITDVDVFYKKTDHLIKEIIPTYYELKLNNKQDEDLIINIIQVKIADYYHKKIVF